MVFVFTLCSHFVERFIYFFDVFLRALIAKGSFQNGVANGDWFSNMSDVLFNLHDIFLVMTILLSIVFASNIFLRRTPGDKREFFLIAFLLCQAFIAVHELTLYGVKLRLEVLAFEPNLLFIASLAFCLDGLLLYLYAKSVGQARKIDSFAYGVYAIPLVSYVLYLMAVYFVVDEQNKVDAIKNWSFINTWHFIFADFIVKAIRLTFCVSAFILVRGLSEKQRILGGDQRWIQWFVCSFSVIFAGQFLLSFLKVVGYFTPLSNDLMIDVGVGLYYLGFGVTCLLLCGQIRLNFISQIQNDDKEIIVFSQDPVSQAQVESSDVHFKTDIVNHIEQFMVTQKPYLNAELSIEALASQLSLSVKDLSVTLNRHYQMNFFEFVNCYRLKEAKQLLLAQKDKPITTIYYEVGFNSKSVFYSYFKKSEGTTPSQFRRQYKAVA